MRSSQSVTSCAVLLVALLGCSPSQPETTPGSGLRSPTTAAPTLEHQRPVLMPDLRGLPPRKVSRRVGNLERKSRLHLSSSWDRPVAVKCELRPDTVVTQSPAPGTVLELGTVIHLRTAVLDLKRFRGPCEPPGGELGPLRGADAALARDFYRFAADPSRRGPFGSGDVWLGIESGTTSVRVPEAQLHDPDAWQIGEEYAEQIGPFSVLDVLASSGGYYEVHRGVLPTCGFEAADDHAPPQLAGLRAVTVTAPSDAVMSCMDWWGVTLFLDRQGHIRGVALRLGSP